MLSHTSHIPLASALHLHGMPASVCQPSTRHQDLGMRRFGHCKQTAQNNIAKHRITTVHRVVTTVQCLHLCPRTLSAVQCCVCTEAYFSALIVHVYTECIRVHTRPVSCWDRFSTQSLSSNVVLRPVPCWMPPPPRPPRNPPPRPPRPRGPEIVTKKMFVNSTVDRKHESNTHIEAEQLVVERSSASED